MLNQIYINLSFIALHISIKVSPVPSGFDFSASNIGFPRTDKDFIHLSFIHSFLFLFPIHLNLHPKQINQNLKNSFTNGLDQNENVPCVTFLTINTFCSAVYENSS